MADNGSRLPRLPRGIYWTIGAAIAFGGAIAARILSEHLGEYRVAIWLAGGAAIFLGVGILCLGTRWRLEDVEDDPRGGEG